MSGAKAAIAEMLREGFNINSSNQFMSCLDFGNLLMTLLSSSSFAQLFLFEDLLVIGRCYETLIPFLEVLPTYLVNFIAQSISLLPCSYQLS